MVLVSPPRVRLRRAPGPLRPEVWLTCSS